MTFPIQGLVGVSLMAINPTSLARDYLASRSYFDSESMISRTLVQANSSVHSFPISQSPALEPLPSEKEETVIIKHIKFSGNTAFTDKELAKVVASFLGTEVTVEQLLAIRSTITNLYVSQGYTTSAAFVPPQDISEGIVHVEVVEGELEQLIIEGLNRLQKSYVQERLLLAVDKPLNVKRLLEALQLLQSNPLFKRVQAELKQGTSPYLSILVVKLEESPAFSIALQADNYESPVIGEYQGSVALEHLNLLGFGDRWQGFWGITEGLNQYDFNYAIPINSRDGILKVEFKNEDSEVIESPFSQLGIRAESQTFSFGFRQPIVKTPETEFALGLTLDLRESQTYILNDVPFSFTVGPDRGNSRVTALRFSQEWINRTTQRVLAARSQFSFGLDWFNPTINDLGLDGRFFAWQGQFQWVELLGEDVTLVAQLSSQLTGNPLLPLEQFTIGGLDTVRGYPRNVRIGDSGVAASVEARITLFDEPDGLGTIQVVPFFDFGTVGNNRREVLPPSTLASVGLGLRWQVQDSLFLRLDYGIPLIKLENVGNSLQESGFSFSVQWRTRL
jgi:hemolysin activation/secretion protein